MDKKLLTAVVGLTLAVAAIITFNVAMGVLGIALAIGAMLADKEMRASLVLKKTRG